MPSPGWARLRPVDVDLRHVVTILTVAVAAALAAAGVWSLIDHARFSGDRRASVSVTVYIYTVVFGVLLAMGELGVPKAIYQFFGFLASSSGRAFFLFFFSTLAVSAGWSADRSRISAILMIAAGIAGIVVAVFGLCYGRDHSDAPVPAPDYGGSSGRGAARNTPDNVI